jgi:ankyrin repeat protein
VAALLLVSGAALMHDGSVLAQEKADVKKNDDKDTVALISAASLGKTDRVLTMLNRGVNANEREPVKGGKTALIRAIMSKNINTVKALLDHGADVHLQDGWGRHPMYFCHTSTVEILNLVLAKGGDKDINHGPLFMLVSLCDHGYAPAEMIPILVKAGGNPNVHKERVTPLIASILLEKPAGRGKEYVKALIENKADVNLRDTRKEKMTPLQWAKKQGEKEIIDMLERAGAKE